MRQYQHGVSCYDPYTLHLERAEHCLGRERERVSVIIGRIWFHLRITSKNLHERYLERFVFGTLVLSWLSSVLLLQWINGRKRCLRDCVPDKLRRRRQPMHLRNAHLHQRHLERIAHECELYGGGGTDTNQRFMHVERQHRY